MSSNLDTIPSVKLHLMVYFANGWYQVKENKLFCIEYPRLTDKGPRYSHISDNLSLDKNCSELYPFTFKQQAILDLVWENYSDKDTDILIEFANKFDCRWHRRKVFHNKLIYC